MSIANDLLNEVVARLRSASVVASPATRIRRDHRTNVTLENTPSIHVIDGDENVTEVKSCYWPTKLDFVVSIYVRKDSGSDFADPIKVAVMTALNPSTLYPHKARLYCGRISSVQDIADNDSLRVDMAFRFEYQRGEWSLGE